MIRRPPRSTRVRSSAASDVYKRQFYGCKQPLNYSGYCKPEVDELLTKSRSTLDPALRGKLFEQIAAQVLKDRPIVYLYHRKWLWAYNKKLTGVRTIPDGLMRVQGLKM